jgi:hypothetical protein
MQDCCRKELRHTESDACLAIYGNGVPTQASAGGLSLMTLHMIGAIYCDLLGGVKTPGQACAGFPHRGEVVDVTDGAPVVAYQAGTAAARKGDLAG